MNKYISIQDIINRKNSTIIDVEVIDWMEVEHIEISYTAYRIWRHQYTKKELDQYIKNRKELTLLL